MKTGTGKLSLKAAGMFLCCCQLPWNASSFSTHPEAWECSAEPVKHDFVPHPPHRLLLSIFSTSQSARPARKRQMAGISFGEEMSCKDIVFVFSDLTKKKKNARGSLPSLVEGVGVWGVFSQDAQHLLSCCLLRVETQVPCQAEPVFHIIIIINNFYGPFCLSTHTQYI